LAEKRSFSQGTTLASATKKGRLSVNPANRASFKGHLLALTPQEGRHGLASEKRKDEG
jgi:hypothetical protein